VSTHLLILSPSFLLPTSLTHLLKSPQCVKNATIVFFPPEGKASARVVGLPVAALKTWLCFSKEYSGDAGSDFMMEKGEDCRMTRARGVVVVDAAVEGCCLLLSWSRGEGGGFWAGTKAWQHVVAQASAAAASKRRAML